MIYELKEAIYLSEPKLISPLLDGFSMGTPMSDHDGVQCCPAIKENSDKKYIVKIITIPATQTQMDALLLAGAYKDPADAMDYYKAVGEGVMKEAELLKTLSRLEGFLSYDAWQMEPITKRRLGYQVYLIGSYKRSLDKFVRRNPVTHLEAVNLGLDLCAALCVCRQAGSLYVDLKPANIFMSEKKEYRIGDLGFISLDALKYTTLPEKYRSSYTAPELHDPMAELNLTADTYAVGMILYQLYNEGQLPFKDKAPEEALPSPVNADYELAEIIMKAIHPDPAQRWDDPKDMGKALASYMQRNAVNDVPITPYTPLEIAPEDVMLVPKKKEENSEIPAEEEPAVDELSIDENTPAEEASTPESPAEDPPCEEPSDALAEPPAQEAEPADEAAAVQEEPLPEEEHAEELQHAEMSEELSRIIAKADDLIAHETPEGVVIPEIPEPPDPFAFAKEDSDEVDDSDIPVDPVMDDPDEEKAKKKKAKSFASQEGKRKAKKIFSSLITLLILAGIGCGIFWAYQNLYLQTIDSITIDGNRNQLTVVIDSDVNESLLTITCSDNYGNTATQNVVNGQAVFTGLEPNTMYTIRLDVEGFHKLVGKTSDIFTTDSTTSIVTFTAVTGAEDGSVMLNFTVDGQEPEEWAIVYTAEGEEEQRQTFTGHSITVSGLSIGKVYTFRLDAGEELSLSGKTDLQFMASRLILAEDLTVTTTGNSDMTVRWNAPGDIVVESWDVRCYNEAGYEEQLTVNDTEVYLTGIDSTVSYTVEVTASGMTQPARTSITANPINVTALDVDESDLNQLTVSWEYAGEEPAGGWLLMYSMGGNETQVVKCEQASAVIDRRIPGAKYQFTIQAADGTSIFNNVHSYNCPEAEVFAEYGYTAADVAIDLLKTPENANWRYENIRDDDFTTQFTSGDKISMVLRSSSTFYLPGSALDILYVIRDAHGNVLADYVSEDSTYWKEIWLGGDSKNGELDLPVTPVAPGDYTLNVYFNGLFVAELSFSITQ